MSYITEDQFITIYGDKEFSELTDRDNLGPSSVGVFDLAAAKADALIDDTLSEIYTVPFTAPIPYTIVNIAEALTRYELYSLRPSDDVTDQYERALNLLEQLATGKLKLAGVTQTGKRIGIRVNNLIRG